jgi:hypothetical protein
MVGIGGQELGILTVIVVIAVLFLFPKVFRMGHEKKIMLEPASRTPKTRVRSSLLPKRAS